MPGESVGYLELDNNGTRWPKIMGLSSGERLLRIDFAERLIVVFPELRIAIRFLSARRQPQKITAPFPGYCQLDAPKFVGLELVDRQRLVYQAWPGDWSERSASGGCQASTHAASPCRTASDRSSIGCR